MKIKKLNRAKLNDMINNVNQEQTISVIKFYAETCPMCVNLRDYYVDISRKFSKINFCVFDMSKGQGIEDELGFYGTPTICMIKTGENHDITVMDDPENPSDHTWYRSSDIIKFIRDNKDQ